MPAASGWLCLPVFGRKIAIQIDAASKHLTTTMMAIFVLALAAAARSEQKSKTERSELARRACKSIAIASIITPLIIKVEKSHLNTVSMCLEAAQSGHLLD